MDNTGQLGRTNTAVTGTLAYAGKQALSGETRWDGAEHADPAGSRRAVHRHTVQRDGLRRRHPGDLQAHAERDPVRRRRRAQTVGPGETGQLNDPGPSAARTAIAYARDKDEMYVFQGGSYTPDQIQDLFRGLGSDIAVLLDGGGSSAIVLRRDSGGMWAGAGSPRGSCDTMQVLCDARERALPSWLAFD